MLGQARGQAVAIGVSPGAEAALAAGVHNGLLHLGQNGVEVAGLSGQVQIAQGIGIAHERRGQVGLDEVAAQLQQALQQGSGMGVVGAEVGGILTVLLDPLGGLLQHVGLGAGDAHVGGGIGSGLQDELHAELLAGLLHDGHTAAHGLIGHVPGEGDVDKGVAAQLVGGADDQVAAGDEVVVAHQVGGGAHHGQILVGLAGDAQDVGAALLDLSEGLGGAGDGLVDDDGLHQRIVGHVDDGLDRGLQLLGEVVGISGQLDLILAVLGLNGLGAAQVVLRLRDGAGNDADVPVPGGGGVALLRLIGAGVCVRGGGIGGGVVLAAASGEGQNHHQRQQHAEKLLHCKPPNFFVIPAHNPHQSWFVHKP